MERPFARRGDFLGLSWALVGLHAAVFIFASSEGGRGAQLLAYTPGAIASGRWWTLFTYQFVAFSAAELFWNGLSFIWIGTELEREWGTTTFAVFYLCGVFGASGMSAAIGLPLAGSPFLGVSFLITYALIWPDVEFRIWFVLPVRVKYLAMIAAGFVLMQGLSLGPVLGGVYVLGMSAGVGFYAIFLRPRRRLVRDAVQMVKEAGRVSGEEKLAQRNRDFFRRVSSLRPPGGTEADAPGGADLEKLRSDLRAAIASDVRICKPVDYKGENDPICVHCEGFAECSLRYLHGAPKELTMEKPSTQP